MPCEVYDRRNNGVDKLINVMGINVTYVFVMECLKVSSVSATGKNWTCP